MVAGVLVLLASPGKATYTNADIIAIEDANRTKFNTANQIAVYHFLMESVILE
jgi:hypothetical protein